MKDSRSRRRISLTSLLLRKGSLERDRAHLANLYLMLSQANQAMLRATSEDALFQDICRICVDYGHFGLARIAVLKEGQLCTAASAGPMQGFLDGLKVSPDPDDPLGQGPTGRAFRGERSVVCEDWSADPSLEPWREQSARFGILAGGSFPVQTQLGVAAVLTLYADRMGQFQPDRINLLEELTSDMAFAMDKFRLEQQNQVAEAGLAASLGHWRATFDAMEEAVCLLDLEGRILQANAGFTRLLGCSQASALDHRCHEIHHGTLGFLEGCPFQAMLASGKRESVEIHLKDRWFEVVADPLRDPQGLLIGAVHVLRDVTAPRLAAEQLSQERKFYQDLINTQPSGVYQILFATQNTPPSSHWMPSLKGHYLVQYVSDRFCQLLGLSREAFTADPSILSTQFLPEDGTSFLETRAQAVRENRGFQWEGQIGSGDRPRWVRFESYPRVLEEGTTLWTGVITDSTDRKQAEAVLQEEQRVFQDLVTALPAGIYRLRVLPTPAITGGEWERVHLASYKVEFVSDRFCAIAGLSREAFQADPGLIIAQIHPADRVDFSARNAEALTQMVPFRWEGRLLGDAAPRWIRFESTPRLLPDGGSLWTGVLTDITDRRMKSDEFRRIHSLLRQVETIAKVGGWEIDLEASTLYWSDEVFRIHELEPRSYTPTVESSIQFYAPEWRPVITRAVQRAIETGETFDLDLELLTATGRRVWVHATSQVVQKDGRVIRVLGAFRDITQERQAAATLAEKHAVLAGIMESAEGPIFSVDRAYCYTSFNQAHAVVMQALYGAEISLGSCLLDHQTVPEDRDTAKANLDRAMAGASFREEAASGEPGRSQGYFEVAHTPIWSAEGAVTGVAVFARDITLRRTAEEGLRRVTDLLSQAERIAGVGGWEVDLEAQTLFWTEQTYAIHDLEPGAYVPTVETALQFYAPEWRPIITLAVQEAIETGRNFDLELEVITAKGRRIWIHTTGRTRLRDGQVVKVLGAFQDITAQKLAEEALQQSESENRALIKAIPDLIFTNHRNGEYLAVHAMDPTLLLMPPEAFLHRKIQEILPEPLAFHFMKAFADALDQHTVQELHYALPVRGDTRHFEARVAHCTEDTVVTIVRDITERVEAEKAQRESERQLRSILDNMQDVYFRANLAGKFLHISPSAPAIYGYASVEEMMDLAPTDFYLRPEVRQGLTDMLQAGIGVHDWIGEGRRKDGSGFWVSMNIQYVRDEQGLVIGTEGVVRDIHARMQAEADLRESEHRYRLISENAADVIWVLDVAQGRFTYVSPSVERLLGYTAEEVLSQPLEPFLTPESQRRVRRYRAETFALYEAGDETCRATILQLEQPRRDGSIVPVEVATTLLKDVHGKVSHVLGVSRDITERKQSEAKVAEALAKALRFSKALDRTSACIFMKDRQHRFMYANQSMLELFQCSAEDLVGSDDARFFPPNTAAQLQAVDDRVLEHGEDTAQELELQLANGEPRIFWEIKTPIYDEANPGEILGLCGVSTDITAWKRAEGKIREQLDELQRWQGVMLNREDRVQQLKREVNDLAHRLGESVRYASQAGSTEAASEAPKP